MTDHSYGSTEIQWGSDVVVDFLCSAGIRHVAVNPGATLRGLHDSMLRVDSPELITALHEEIAVGIAHGYAKAARRPMAVLLHDMVGLQHATMAIFNAWADNIPMLLLGGSGPRDTFKRRPWIDWVHSGVPQAAAIRDIVKWDTEPASLEALSLALRRAWRMALTAPPGPVYVSVDVLLQEERLGAETPEILVPSMPPPLIAPREAVSEIADLLLGSERPVLMVDRPSPGTLAPLVDLADRTAAAVIDLFARCSFPTNHWADQSEERESTLGEADFVLLIEPRDPAHALGKTDEASRLTDLVVSPGIPMVAVGLSEIQHTGLIERGADVPGLRHVLSDPAGFLNLLVEEVSRRHTPDRKDRVEELRARHNRRRSNAQRKAAAQAKATPISAAHLATELWKVIRPHPWQLANGKLAGWPRRIWDFEHEDEYLGRSGGEGLGYGLPASVGAALASQGTDRLVVDIQADGDLLYTPSALWTAAHHSIPLLVITHNNRRYGRDEIHQRTVARTRSRPVPPYMEGIHLEDPPVDFAQLARSFGVEGIGPVEDPEKLGGFLTHAVDMVLNEQRPVLVDVVSSSE